MNARHPRWLRSAGVISAVAVLLLANFYLRHTLEEAPQRMYSFLETFYKPAIPILFWQLPWWRLFLPLPQLTGSWCTTTLILIYLVERVLTPAGAWELFNAISIVTAFTASWIVFRSAVFSLTLAICIGFGTQFYHAYAVTGGIASYLVVTYHMLLLLAAVQLVRGDRPRWAWQAAFAASLALNVLSYEGWLDLLVLVWVAAPLVYLGLRGLDKQPEARRFVRIVLVLTAVGIAYVIVKITLGYGQSEGSESDVVFNYRNFWPVVDDLIANLFTHAYLSVSNFLPPALVGATSFYRLGSDTLVAAQHQYHGPFSYLVIMNQVFLWRFYAGIAFAATVYGLWATVIRVARQPSLETIALGVFLLMILVAGPTHTLIKFRPMNAEPAMNYHVTVGVLGMSLLISWLLTTAWRRMTSRALATIVVAAVWTMIFYSALARPPYLAHMAAQAGLGESLYPNPMQVLMRKLRLPYEEPRGFGLYRLVPYKRDATLTNARALLGELPLKLPPPNQWVLTAEAATTMPIEGGGVEVTGDASQGGYQLMSPPLAIRPNTQYLLRVRFETPDGSVCAGVLTGDQQRWLASPDGSTAESAFNSAQVTSVRAVLANCNVQSAGNPRSRIRLSGGSYAAIDPQP